MYWSIAGFLILVVLAAVAAKQYAPFKSTTQEVATDSNPATASPTNSLPEPQDGDMDITVCDPGNGPFSLNINNPYLPYPVGLIHIMESAKDKVQISVLNETKIVAGVTTRVVEEREWEEGELSEVSRNFFAQAPDGTVCYYGEEVDEYKNGQIVSHGGAWRAGENQNKPGIAMPAKAAVGQMYQQEQAPGIAMDRSEHVADEPSFTTPAGVFKNVLLVEELPESTKRYARGVGMIFDDGAVLTISSSVTNAL